MGSKGIKPRKPRRKLPPAGASGTVGWEAEGPGSQYTPGGYLRGIGRFARGSRTAAGAKGTAARAGVLAVLVFIVGTVVAGLVQLLD